MKKRIGFVQPVLAPYAVPRFEALASNPDLEIHILLEKESFTERPGWQPREITGCSLHVLKSPSYTKTVIHSQLGYQESYTKALPLNLSSRLVKLKLDAVVACNPTQVLLAMPAKLLRGFKLGLVLEDTVQAQLKKNPYVRFLRAFAYRKVDFVLSFSALAREYAESIGIISPIYDTSWSIDSHWLSFRRLSEIGHTALRFLTVGQLNERKGTMPLLSAWAKFSKETQDATLTLIGDGPLREEAQDFCKDLPSVQFVGQIPYDQVRDYYLSSDVFILPTLEDLFSLVVTEAMAFGLPVLTTTHNGASSLVKEGVNGFIFEPSTDGILSVLRRTQENAHELHEFGAASRSFIADYTHDLVMERLAKDLLHELGN